MKNLLRTTLLSILLFLILVFLGVKYHWATYLQDKKKEQETTFTLPENTNLFVTEGLQTEPDKEYQPALIHSVNNKSALKNMTKQQIIKACEILSSNTEKDVLQKELFVGNCVVSNYNETIQDSVVDQPYKSPQQVNQARDLCMQQLSNGNSKWTLELELLTGVCVSNHLNR